MLPANALYKLAFSIAFQRAPTLGGECYSVDDLRARLRDAFQWAPTLGGECYQMAYLDIPGDPIMFQWAPTLGG